MILLEARDITKTFGGVVANDHIDLNVNRGEILGIIGPNGSGKTTFFNVITGFIRADSGSVVFSGHNVVGLRPDQIANLGMVRTFQKLRPFANMTARENVMVSLLSGGLGVDEAKKMAMEYLEIVGISHMVDMKAMGFSTGQRKRLELARAMALHPTLLLLDEPTGGVDPSGCSRMVDLIRRIRDTGITIIVIEHRMKVLAAIADRLVALRAGRKIAEGAPEAVLKTPEVVEAYLGG